MNTKELRLEQQVNQTVDGMVNGGENTSVEATRASHARDLADLPAWQKQFIEAFIEALQECPIVGKAIAAACKAAGQGISRQTAYKWRERDHAFRQAWDDAIETGWDRAEAEAFRRAVEGVEVPVFGKNGEVVGSRVEHSDRLLELLLKGNRAKTYRETAGPLVNINLGSTEAIEAAKTSEELKRFALEFAKSGGKLAENGGSA